MKELLEILNIKPEDKIDIGYREILFGTKTFEKE